MSTDLNFKVELRALRAISEGARSSSELKKVLRRNVRSVLDRLVKDGSVINMNGKLILSKRGAGRLRFVAA